jgi:erythromycin esterase-like protein
MTTIQDDPALPLLRDNLTPIPPLSESTTALTNFITHLHTTSPAEPKVILIGDASHGTSEFYTARAELTKHLIQHHGFNIVAVEADWPDAEAVDRYVRQRPGPGVVSRVEPVALDKEQGREPAFMRFPTWMWRNQEVRRFTEWLRGWNSDVIGRGEEEGDKGAAEAVGFYGLDLYSLGTSMKAVVEYLERVDPEMAKVAAERYGRMMMWAEEPHEYGLEALASGFKGCEKDVMRVLRDLLAKRLEYAAWGKDGEEFHSGEQNARLVKGEFPDLQERADLRETLLLTGGRRRTVLQGHVLRPRRVLESAGHAHV